jgi:NADH-quinone oxidoreductase subunit C
MNHSLKELLQVSFDGILVDVPEENRVVITAGKEAVLSILSFLKNHGYNHLGIISCVDWIEDDSFELVYILHAYTADGGDHAASGRDSVLLKTMISREQAICISVIPIFRNAEPYERELHELYGIHFEGHPRLTPLFLEREYQTPPFRKDFDTREYVQETFDSIPFIDKETGNQ